MVFRPTRGGYRENRFNERECKPTAFHQHIDAIINGGIEP